MLANDIHILDLPSLVPIAFDHFASQLVIVGLYVQSCKCDVWSPFGLPLSFSPLMVFVAFQTTLEFQGSPVVLCCFFFFFKDVLGEDVHYVSLLPRLGDVQVDFGILF